jgi:uncharacterized protein
LDPVTVVLAAVVMLVGLAGIIVPVLPGLSLVWLAAVGAFALEGMGTAGWVVAALVSVQLAVGTAAKYVLASTGGDERPGARTVGLAVVGGVVGFVVLPVVGFAVGALVGVLVGEHRRLGDWTAARAATRRIVTRFGIGVVVEVGAGLAMVVTFAVAVAVRW